MKTKYVEIWMNAHTRHHNQHANIMTFGGYLLKIAREIKKFIVILDSLITLLIYFLVC